MTCPKTKIRVKGSCNQTYCIIDSSNSEINYIEPEEPCTHEHLDDTTTPPVNTNPGTDNPVDSDC